LPRGRVGVCDGWYGKHVEFVVGGELEDIRWRRSYITEDWLKAVLTGTAGLELSPEILRL